MSSRNRDLLFVWLFIGLPLLAAGSLWGNSFWFPFPIAQGESLSYYFVWLMAFALIYGLPIILAAKLAAYLWRKSKSPE